MSSKKFLSEIPTITNKRIQSTGFSADSYAFLQKYISQHSGIILDEDKRYLIESRLIPIIRNEGITSIDSLCEFLALGTSRVLDTQVIEAMTTNETLFFRDAPLFSAIGMQVIPAALNRVQGRRKIRIWSAAASTGQEAYSLVMLLLEAGINHDQVEILGTDISEHVLRRARLGRYNQFEMDRGLPSILRAKYFTKLGHEWQLKDEVLKMVQFRQVDLRNFLGSTGMWDLILCRNVLIYFDAETKQNVLSSMQRVLVQGGVLALGCAETIINYDGSFQRKMIGQATLYSM